MAEDDFAASVAAHLDQLVSGRQGREFVLVAAPRTLGELRKHLSKAATAAVVAEVSKDLTGQSATQVERAIEAAS